MVETDCADEDKFCEFSSKPIDSVFAGLWQKPF